jgi:mRNA-degrading endonuclease YafQ of YafQ-DinJ toxin-antitoxin module
MIMLNLKNRLTEEEQVRLIEWRLTGKWQEIRDSQSGFDFIYTKRSDTLLHEDSKQIRGNVGYLKGVCNSIKIDIRVYYNVSKRKREGIVIRLTDYHLLEPYL